jgi:hypothetical protein
MGKAAQTRYAFVVILASAVISLQAAATAEPLCSSSATRLATRFAKTPCSSTSARSLLIEAGSAQPEDSSSRTTLESTSATAVPSSGLETKTRSPHKFLAPVSKADVAVFVLAGFVLFIAAGAGAVQQALFCIHCNAISSTWGHRASTSPCLPASTCTTAHYHERSCIRN